MDTTEQDTSLATNEQPRTVWVRTDDVVDNAAVARSWSSAAQNSLATALQTPDADGSAALELAKQTASNMARLEQLIEELFAHAEQTADTAREAYDQAIKVLPLVPTTNDQQLAASHLRNSWNHIKWLVADLEQLRGIEIRDTFWQKLAR